MELPTCPAKHCRRLVVAVDPAALNSSVLQQPNVVHLRMRSEEALPKFQQLLAEALRRKRIEAGQGEQAQGQQQQGAAAGGAAQAQFVQSQQHGGGGKQAQAPLAEQHDANNDVVVAGSGEGEAQRCVVGACVQRQQLGAGHRQLEESDAAGLPTQADLLVCDMNLHPAETTPVRATGECQGLGTAGAGWDGEYAAQGL